MRYRIAALLCLTLAALAGLSFHTVSPSPVSYLEAGRVNTEVATQHWSNLIREEGPAKAHDAMVTEAAALAPDEQHTAAHTFGTALYQSGGPAYAPYCGLEFLYGCYHQFFGLAISEFGLSVMKTLDTACASAPVNTGSCAHGAGHAILSTYGYTPDAFKKTEKDCTVLYDKPWDRVFCTGGAVMEYNFREVLDGEKRATRPFSEETAYEPCLTAEPQFQKECLYQLPPWWYTSFSSLPGERAAVYAHLGQVCRALTAQKHPELIPACFAGIGFSIANNEAFDTEKIVQACGTAGRNSNEKLYCLSHAAQQYYLGHASQTNICSAFGLAGKEQSFCETYQTLGRDKALELPSPDLTDVSS